MILRPLALIAALSVCALPARSDSGAFCTGLSRLAGSLVEPSASVDQSFALPDDSAAQMGCSTSLGLGGARSKHCMWSFDFRADAARLAFEALLDQMGACGFDAAQQDARVNHPDSYDLRVFGGPEGSVSISLKDKGALRQTLVFLTVSLP